MLTACCDVTATFHYFDRAQNLLKPGFKQVCNSSATSYRQVGDKSPKLVADLLDQSLWRCDKQTFLVGNMFPTSQTFFLLKTCLRLVFGKTEVMEFGLNHQTNNQHYVSVSRQRRTFRTMVDILSI